MRYFYLAALPLSLLLAGCAGKTESAPPPPPPEVSVLTVRTEPVQLTTELPGRIRAVREAQVRARATGILLKRLFEEGANVEEGQVLFEIDPEPLQARLSSAEAELASAEAALKESRAIAGRYRELVKISAVSQQVFDQAVATMAKDEAELLAKKAAVRTAQLELGYTKVTAPISGRIGRALVTEGALVSAQEATQLAVIHQLDPVYLDVTQSSIEVLRLRRALESGSMGGVPPEEARIHLVLEDGTEYPHPGKLLFSDISVDQTTSMITIRALVPNPHQTLMPGMFARAKVVQGMIPNAVTVPQRTVARGAAGAATVLVVDEKNTVQVRQIQIDREVGTNVVVSAGLKAGERIIVEGSQKAPPGSTVKTVPFAPVTVASSKNVAEAPKEK